MPMQHLLTCYLNLLAIVLITLFAKNCNSCDCKFRLFFLKQYKEASVVVLSSKEEMALHFVHLTRGNAATFDHYTGDTDNLKKLSTTGMSTIRTDNARLFCDRQNAVVSFSYKLKQLKQLTIAVKYDDSFLAVDHGLIYNGKQVKSVKIEWSCSEETSTEVIVTLISPVLP